MYKLLVDSGSAINLRKESEIPPGGKPFKMIKKFVMGHDLNYSHQAIKIPYFNKTHLFLIVNDDFPLPEEGIIGRPFLKAYEKYHLTFPDFLYINERKLPLYQDGNFVPNNTVQLTKIQIEGNDKDIFIDGNDNIPSGLYRIKDNKTTIPIYNYGNHLMKKPETINYEEIESINQVTTEELPQVETKPEGEHLIDRINNLYRKTRLEHIEEPIGKDIWRIVSSFNDVLH